MDEQAPLDVRRAYWAHKMDEAYAFMEEVRQQPVQECGEPLVSLVDAVKTAGVAVEFSSKPHVRGLPRLYYMRAGLIPSFIAAAGAMNERGWVMRVEDGLRTCEMQKYLALEPYTFDVVLERVLWELDGAPLSSDLMLRRVASLVAASAKVGTHISGSAIDISVLDRATGEEVDRGCPYLEMSELTPMESPFVPPQAQANRAAITALMAEHGLIAYPWEFWHYNAGDVYEAVLLRTGEPARYGAIDADLATGEIEPVADPLAAFNPLDEIQRMLDLALKRRALASA